MLAFLLTLCAYADLKQTCHSGDLTLNLKEDQEAHVYQAQMEKDGETRAWVVSFEETEEHLVWKCDSFKIVIHKNSSSREFLPGIAKIQDQKAFAIQCSPLQSE